MPDQSPVSFPPFSSAELREGNLKAVLGLFFALSRHKQQLQQEDQARKKAAKAHQSGAPSQLNKSTHSAIPQQKTAPSTERVRPDPKWSGVIYGVI